MKELYNTDLLLTHDIIPYLKEARVYIGDDGVFDEDFNLISKLPVSANTSLFVKGRTIVLDSRYSTEISYEIPILSYEEMLEYNIE